MEELKIKIYDIIYNKKTTEIMSVIQEYLNYKINDNHQFFIDYLIFIKQEIEDDYVTTLDLVYLDIITMMYQMYIYEL
jgi:hypothetical protein